VHTQCAPIWCNSHFFFFSLRNCPTHISKLLTTLQTVCCPATALQVVGRCVSMAGLLGCSLAVVLALGRSSIPSLFSSDPAVLHLVAALLPFVIISQPINALAFVWDGVLFGAGGFR